jgi:uncharacterized protein YxeA
MKKQTMYIIVAVLVIVIVVAGAAAFLLMNNGNGGTGATPTPTPEPTPTVVDATTLQFSVAETTSGVTLNYNFAAKNVNTTTEVLRMDIIDAAGNYSYIIDLGASTSFLKINDGAWTASDFNTDSSYIVAFSDYQTALINWNGHDATYSYTAASGSSIVISAIHVNPTLPDSTFSTS